MKYTFEIARKFNASRKRTFALDSLLLIFNTMTLYTQQQLQTRMEVGFSDVQAKKKISRKHRVKVDDSLREILKRD